MQKINFKKMRPGARLPARQTDGAAAADLYACLDAPLSIAPGERADIPCGVAMELPDSTHAALIFSRSGHGRKFGVTLANSVGLIDSDYRGELCSTLINLGSEPFTVSNGDRIAQLMVISGVCPFTAVECAELGATGRGEGGFGSTGTR